MCTDRARQRSSRSDSGADGDVGAGRGFYSGSSKPTDKRRPKTSRLTSGNLQENLLEIRLGLRLRPQLGQRAVGHFHAAIDGHDPAADLLDEVQKVGGDDDGRAASRTRD